MKGIRIIETNSEIGAGTRGASMGGDAIKIASINAGSDFFLKNPVEKIENENHILFEKREPSFAKNIEEIIEIYKRLSSSLKNTINDGFLPIVLAGDHSSAAGTIAGLKGAFPEKRLGVIWVDAHADLHTPYTTPSGNVHGMPLAIALGEDNLDKKNNEISNATKEHWEALKNISGTSSDIKFEDLIFIGVRDTEEEEEYLIDKHNIKKYTVTDVRSIGTANLIREINDYLEHCDLIYISFDVDSMDCNYVSHGTGTPVPVGFSEKEVTHILLGLLANEKICCFEITEVNPTLDEKCNRMAETAFRVLEKSANLLQGK